MLDEHEYLNLVETKAKESWPVLLNLLWGRDVLLIGGNLKADDIKFSKEEKKRFFFVQLNHHLFRRFRNAQPCDWLICRQGSGMVYEKYLTLPEYLHNRIKVISCQASQPEKFISWCQSGKSIFPFHEKGFLKPSPYGFHLEWCNQFWNELGTNPLMGMLALKMILLFPVRSVKLLGFDFFAMPKGGLRKKLGCHNLTRQMQWLRHHYETDYRIELEPDLIKMIGASEPRGCVPPFELP